MIYGSKATEGFPAFHRRCCCVLLYVLTGISCLIKNGRTSAVASVSNCVKASVLARNKLSLQVCKALLLEFLIMNARETQFDQLTALSVPMHGRWCDCWWSSGRTFINLLTCLLLNVLRNEYKCVELEYAIHIKYIHEELFLTYKHDDVIKWKHFPRNWPFVRGIHRSSVNSPHKGRWRGALMISFDLRLNKRLSKQSWGWWFETLSRSLWRHRNELPSIGVPFTKVIS